MLSDRTFDFDQGRDAKISGSVSFCAWTSLKHSVHVSEQCKALLRVELEPNGMGIFLIVPYPALFGCFPMRTCGGIPVTSVPLAGLRRADRPASSPYAQLRGQLGDCRVGHDVDFGSVSAPSESVSKSACSFDWTSTTKRALASSCSSWAFSLRSRVICASR